MRHLKNVQQQIIRKFFMLFGSLKNNAPEKIINIRFYTNFNICNYSCPYCIAGQNDKQNMTTRWDSANLDQIIQNLTYLPYKINVRIGVKGEFFLSKKLTEGARLLSLADNVHSVNLITNLSFSYKQYENFLHGFDHSKTSIVASYHPSEIKDKEKWIQVACHIKKRYDFAVVLVGYPPFIKDLLKIKKELTGYGIEVFVQGFIGNYNGREYPGAYTVEEKKLLRKVFYSRHDYEFFAESKKPGLCNAGYRSFYVDMTGMVRPCGMGALSPVIGNLLSNPEIKPWDGPRPCMYDACLCDTENINTVIFEQHYRQTGINQHKYIYRFKNEAEKFPQMDEWKINY